MAKPKIIRLDNTPGRVPPALPNIHPVPNRHPVIPRREGLRIRISPVKGLSAKWMKKDYVFQNGPLDSFEVDFANESDRSKTLRDGEYSRRTGRSLIMASFQTLAVIIPYPWVMDKNVGFDIDALTHDLVRICEDGHPFELLCTYSYDADPFLHLRAARMENLKVIAKSGETDAIYFDVAFSEYRDSTAPVSGKSRAGQQDWPQSVQLHKDGRWHWKWKRRAETPLTLAKIAKVAYGAPSKWRLIADANGIKHWGANSALINYSKYRKKGGTIKVPDPHKDKHRKTRHAVLGDSLVRTPGDDHGD